AVVARMEKDTQRQLEESSGRMDEGKHRALEELRGIEVAAQSATLQLQRVEAEKQQHLAEMQRMAEEKQAHKREAETTKAKVDRDLLEKEAEVRRKEEELRTKEEEMRRAVEEVRRKEEEGRAKEETSREKEREMRRQHEEAQKIQEEKANELFLTEKKLREAMHQIEMLEAEKQRILHGMRAEMHELHAAKEIATKAHERVNEQEGAWRMQIQRKEDDLRSWSAQAHAELCKEREELQRQRSELERSKGELAERDKGLELDRLKLEQGIECVKGIEERCRWWGDRGAMLLGGDTEGFAV
ncbi:hypothetical protein CYMTET_45978, partial [Cymbomonas tetramitiformis]